jgi:hypothetical protein
MMHAFNMTSKANDKVCKANSRHLHNPRLAAMSKSQMKSMLITFFDIKGIADSEFNPQGRTANQAHYVDTLRGDENVNWLVWCCETIS